MKREIEKERKKGRKRKVVTTDSSCIILVLILPDTTLGNAMGSVYSIRATRIFVMGYRILTVNHSR